MEQAMKTPKGRGSKAGKRRALALTDINKLPLTVTIPQFAEIFGCTRQHAWHLVRTGQIATAAPLGRTIRITRPTVLEIYRSRKLIAADKKLAAAE
jgi:hypothetical protein